MKPRLLCPNCRSTLVRRTRRKGRVEQLLSVVFVYPFRCDRCLHRFRAMRWGRRYVRRTA